MSAHSDSRKNFGEHIGNGLDKLIGIFSPKAAFNRMKYRQANGIISASGGYKGASNSRLRSTWLPGSNSADADILGDLSTLRARSRDLNRNDANAAGLTSTMTTNVIGNGIRLQATIDAKALGIEKEKAHELQRQCEKAFDMWCYEADAADRLNFYQIQRLVDRKVLEDGEVLVLPLMVNEPHRKFSLTLDVIEADRLETPGGNYKSGGMRYGIEIGDRGQPLAYNIRKTHPGDIYSIGNVDRASYMRIPARNEYGRKNVLHIFEQDRPGQTRGVPWFAPIMGLLKDLGEYIESEQVAARVAACIALFVESEDASTLATGQSESTNADGQKIEGMEPGMVKYLNPGQKVTGFNPNRPATAFDVFTTRVLRGIAAGLNLPYEIVAKDFSRTNYSSARAALLQAYRLFKQRQQFLVWSLCMPIYEMVIEEAFLRGYVDFPGFYENRYEFTRSRWIAAGWSWVDPMKEAQAAELSINIGVSTLADECGARGQDWEETLEQRAREMVRVKELEKENGIKLFPDQAADSPAQDPGEQEEEVPSAPKEQDQNVGGER